VENYKNTIIGYIDILGFKELIISSNTSQDDFNKILKILNEIKSCILSDKFIDTDVSYYRHQGKYDYHEILNQIKYKTFSDSVIITITSDRDDNTFHNKLDVIVSNICYLCSKLLLQGILTRGCITFGNVYDEDSIIFGSAFIEAYETEQKLAMNPRVVIGKKLLEYMNYPIVSKNQRYTYHGYIRRDSDGCIGFNALMHWQVQQNDILTDDIISELQTVRLNVVNGINKNTNIPQQFIKWEYIKDKFNSLVINTESYQHQKINKPGDFGDYVTVI
jgi:hypothetical protein